MNSLSSFLLMRSLKISLALWVALTALILVVARFGLMAEMLWVFFYFLGSVVIFALVRMLTSESSVGGLLRLQSPSTRSYFFTNLNLGLVGFVFNLGLWIVSSMLVFPSPGEALPYISAQKAVWFALNGLMFYLAVGEHDVLEWQKRHFWNLQYQFYVFAASIAFYGWVIFLFMVVLPVSALAVQVAFFLSFALYYAFFSSMAKKALYPKQRLMFFSALCALMIAVVIGTVVYAKSAGKEAFLLASLGNKAWNYEEYQSLDEPEEWVRWMREAPDLTAEQVIPAYKKFEMICPPRATDYPTQIHCLGHRALEVHIFSTQTITAETVKALILSDSVYAQLDGLLQARFLEKLDPDTEEAVKKIAASQGRLATVAEKTLGDVGHFMAEPRKRALIKVVVHAE